MRRKERKGELQRGNTKHPVGGTILRMHPRFYVIAQLRSRVTVSCPLPPKPGFGV